MIARMRDQHVLVCCAHDICGFRIVVEKLAGMKNGAGRQFQREDDAVGRLDQPPDAASIDGAHRQLDDGQTCRRFGVRMEDANGNRCGRRRHGPCLKEKVALCERQGRAGCGSMRSPSIVTV